jgi:hypothetical protein
LLVGGGLGVLFFFIAQAIGGTIAGWVSAGVGGGLLFILILGLPLLFLAGLRETYLSTVWTLTYRELITIMQQKSILPGNGENI